MNPDFPQLEPSPELHRENLWDPRTDQRHTVKTCHLPGVSSPVRYNSSPCYRWGTRRQLIFSPGSPCFPPISTSSPSTFFSLHLESTWRLNRDKTKCFKKTASFCGFFCFVLVCFNLGGELCKYFRLLNPRMGPSLFANRDDSCMHIINVLTVEFWWVAVRYLLLIFPPPLRLTSFSLSK